MKNRIILALLLFILCGPARADSDAAQRLHEIRSQSFLLCANLLVYYNNMDPAGAFYPEAREAYRRNLAELERLVAMQPELGAALGDMKAAIGQLEQKPENTRTEYSLWLNPVLRAQGDLDKRVAAGYQASGEPPASLAALHQLSLDISRMLLLYESQAFSRTGIYSFEVNENSFNEIDQRIGTTHAGLAQQLPGAGRELKEVWQNYSFVRQRLNASEQQVVARSASLYLGKSVDTLDRLARNSTR
ncbi:hypothetical protein KRX52_08045 [Pseudomonas sp. MAP12]|uniref:NarX-like N-terminal domain-containing protein n=1 Tax=Geopseudomonas aromaticivorans TaxID=2849492 RepID=A0ABS6MVB3_9GAMM|nr:hypothetical protein [Pseudomonas aromaticivorans]MBV2132751.1 hypothetical protein [Pseudomonas aromaticivorans]